MDERNIFFSLPAEQKNIYLANISGAIITIITFNNCQIIAFILRSKIKSVSVFQNFVSVSKQ